MQSALTIRSILALVVGISLGIALFMIPDALAQSGPTLSNPRPVVVAPVGASGQPGPVSISVPRPLDPTATARRYGIFRLVPDTLPGGRSLPQTAVAPIPAGVTTAVASLARIQSSSLFREPSSIPPGLASASIWATERADSLMYVGFSYPGEGGRRLEVGISTLFRAPVDIFYNPVQQLRSLETVLIAGREAVVLRPQPGMPELFPTDIWVVDESTLFRIRGVGVPFDALTRVAESLLP